jgi:hypothetical protein
MQWPKKDHWWLVAAFTAVACLLPLGVLGDWLYHHEERAFQRKVVVGMTTAQVTSAAGPPVGVIPKGGVLPKWGGHPARTVPDDTWVYYFGPGNIHRFAVIFRGGHVRQVLRHST